MFDSGKAEYQHQREYVARFLEKKCRPLAQAAWQFAQERHIKRREDGAPYDVHLAEVAYYLILFGIDADWVLAAAFLHDGPEDQVMAQEEVELKFGDQAARLVAKVTKPEKPNEESMTRYFEEIFLEVESTFLKLIDRLANTKRSMIGFFSRKRLEKYSRETKIVIARLEELIARAEAGEKGRYRKFRPYTQRLRILRGYLKGMIQAADEHIKLMDQNESLVRGIQEAAKGGRRNKARQ